MGPASRQDVQNLIDNSRNQLLQRVALKQDIQLVTETLRNTLSALQQNQQLLRQAEYQRAQATRRIVALETRLTTLEQELKPLRAVVGRMVEQYSQPQQIVVQEQQRVRGAAPEQQYLYRAT